MLTKFWLPDLYLQKSISTLWCFFHHWRPDESENYRFRSIAIKHLVVSKYNILRRHICIRAESLLSSMFSLRFDSHLEKIFHHPLHQASRRSPSSFSASAAPWAQRRVRSHRWTWSRNKKKSILIWDKKQSEDLCRSLLNIQYNLCIFVLC